MGSAHSSLRALRSLLIRSATVPIFSLTTDFRRRILVCMCTTFLDPMIIISALLDMMYWGNQYDSTMIVSHGYSAAR